MAQISSVELTDGTKRGIRAGAIPYGIVDSTSTATAFTATVPGVTELTDGTCVLLKNGVVTSAADFTININGLGAKHAYSNMAAATAETTLFNINYTMLFVYDSTRVSGGGWILYRGYNSNDNTIGYQLRTNSTNLKAADKGYRYRLWFTSTDGTKWVPANLSTATNATTARTLNTRPINPFGPIIYYSSNATTDAGAQLATTTQWEQYAVTIGYSYVLTLVDDKAVYLQCTPQADGSAVMNTITQTLPTTEDGKIYIFLGFAYSTTAMELRPYHPIYYYKEGALRLWTNAPTSSTGQVQANWNETDATSAAYIQNKPTIPSAPVQSNWSESDSSSLAYIQHKPTALSQFENDMHYCTLIDVDDSVANIILMTPAGTNTVLVSEGITSVFYKVQGLPDTIFALPWSQTSGRIYHPVLFDINAGVIQLISYDHDNSEFSFITLTDNNNTSMTGYISTFTLPTKTSDLQNDSNFVVDASYVHTDNNFTTALKDSVEALANVGTVYNTSVTDVSVSSGTWKSIASLSLPKGTFLVNGNPRFGAVTNKGTRQMCLNTSSNANGTHGKVVIDFQATSGSGNVIGMQSSYVFSLSSPTTVYLNVYHTQGSALTVSAELQAVCISAGSTSYQSASGVGF